MLNANEIISLARNLKKYYSTDDPFVIAEAFGIRVLPRFKGVKDFKAHTIKIEGYPTIININGKLSAVSQKVLCAHELGHALMHEETINHFDITRANLATNAEYEANLFAVALLFDEKKFNVPLERMSGSVLKSIMDYNIF